MSLSPLRRQVRVACDRATTYRLFLREIGSWWPLVTHGCFGAGGSLAFDGERIVETGPAGDVAVWGTVINEDEPHAVTFTRSTCHSSAGFAARVCWSPAERCPTRPAPA